MAFSPESHKLRIFLQEGVALVRLHIVLLPIRHDQRECVSTQYTICGL